MSSAGDPAHVPTRPAWSPDGHRVKAPLEYSRGAEKTWVYGGLRVADGQAVTCTAGSRNSGNYQRFLELVEAANPAGDILVITDNLSSHTSLATREWLADHPRIRQVFIPKGGLLAASAGDMVATVSPSGAGRPMLRRRRRDHPGHQGRNPPAQPARPTVGLGSHATVTAPPAASLCLPPLRNPALLTLQS
jgi:hypothetical protein